MWVHKMQEWGGHGWWAWMQSDVKGPQPPQPPQPLFCPTPKCSARPPPPSPQRWAEHHRALRRPQPPTSNRETRVTPDTLPVAPRQPPLSPVDSALRACSGVSRGARDALKKANPYSVMELELKIVEVLERVRSGLDSSALVVTQTIALISQYYWLLVLVSCPRFLLGAL